VTGLREEGNGTAAQGWKQKGSKGGKGREGSKPIRLPIVHTVKRSAAQDQGESTREADQAQKGEMQKQKDSPPGENPQGNTVGQGQGLSKHVH